VAVITLLSDFGLKDPYVAEMKATILSICPGAQIIDISHEIEKFNTRMGAFILASAAPHFPQSTIHVAVVDPGVGTKRRPIIVETGHGIYVGPDNGLLMLSAHKEGMRHVYTISNPQYMHPQVSRTFHGRDIFAPAAAHLARGHSSSDFGVEIHDYILPDFAEPELRKGRLRGEILYVDDFGNIVTNISVRELKTLGADDGRSLRVKSKGEILDLKLCSAYGQVPAGKALAVIGSSDFLEIAVNQASAARILRAKAGESVEVWLR